MKLGLVLSGGGIRGVAHVGVIKALEENGIKPEVLAGTSAGSIVAALYSMGYTPEEMLEMFKKFTKTAVGITPRYLFANIRENGGIKVRGMISGVNLENLIQEFAIKKSISKIIDIKTPIAIVSTDLITGEKIIFTNSKEAKEDYYIKNIEVGKAVRASSSVPGVYTPLEIRKLPVCRWRIK